MVTSTFSFIQNNVVCGLHNTCSFLTFQEAGKAKIQVEVQNPVSSEDTLPDLQTATFSLYLSHMAVSREGEGASSLLPLTRGCHPHNLITPQRPHLQIPMHWGVRLQYLNLEGHKHSVPSKAWSQFAHASLFLLLEFDSFVYKYII